MNKISVIVPVYKAEKYLDTCVKSLTNQTYRNIEIILVDDGSPDNCPAMCDEWAQKDNRIKVIHKQNSGLSSARNAGLKIATGDYIGFVDSDDYLETEMYDKLVKAITDNSCDIGTCLFCRRDESGNVLPQTIDNKYSYDVYTSTQILDEFYETIDGNLISACNKIFEKELFDGVLFPHGKLHEDWYVIFKLYYKSKGIACCNYEGYNYLDREDSIMHTPSLKRFVDCVLADYEQWHFFNSQGISKYNSKIKFMIWSDYKKSVKYTYTKEDKKLLKPACNKCGLVCNKVLCKILYVMPWLIRIMYKIKSKLIK